MRSLAVLASLSVAVVIALSSGPGAKAVSAAAAGCPPRAVPAATPLSQKAQEAFTAAFARIRQYLSRPTLQNQMKMYTRVDASLFQYYSYQGGVLGASNGKASGGFTFRFVPGSDCITRSTGIVSFRVKIGARFSSTNHKRLRFDRVASIQMKTPRIFRYIDPVTR
jgi:hypothetical protein